MRMCNLVSGIRSVPSDSREGWVVQKREAQEHTDLPVLLKASLQPGVGARPAGIITTKVRRTSSPVEQASSVFKWDGLIPGWVMLSFPQALPDLSKGLILKVEMGKKKKKKKVKYTGI